MVDSPQLLQSVSIDELEALASGQLVSTSQQRIDALLSGAKESRLSADEEAELDDLLHKIDQLNLLKARARFTIDHFGTMHP